MGFVVLDDRSGRIEVSLFADVFGQAENKISNDAIVVIEGEVQNDEFSGALRVRAKQVYNIEETRKRFVSRVHIDCCEQQPKDLPVRLRRCLEPFRTSEAGCPVALRYQASSAVAQIDLGREWQVAPTDELLQELRDEFGPDRVVLLYA